MFACDCHSKDGINVGGEINNNKVAVPKCKGLVALIIIRIHHDQSSSGRASDFLS